MKTLYISAFWLVAAMPLFAQTFDEKKQWVREKYTQVETNLDNFTKKSYLDQPDPDYPPMGYYYFWYNSENQVVKAIYSMGEEGYSDERNYYFSEGKLFFVYKVSCEPDWESENFVQDCTQYRTYLYNEKVFDCLYKDVKTSDKGKYIPNKQLKTDYSEETEKLLKEAEEMLQLAEKSE